MCRRFLCIFDCFFEPSTRLNAALRLNIQFFSLKYCVKSAPPVYAALCMNSPRLCIQISVCACKDSSDNCISFIDIFLNTSNKIISQWFNCFINSSSNSINFSFHLRQSLPQQIQVKVRFCFSGKLCCSKYG